MLTFQDAARALFAKHGILPVAVAGKMPLGGTGWNTLSLDDRLIMFGATMCTGLGLQAGFIFHPVYGPCEMRVVDIDVNDAARQYAFVVQFLTVLGTEHAPKIVFRWGRRPACIVFVRQAGAIAREWYGSPKSEVGAIQLLGAGKQAVWWGTHPDTAQPYTHPDGDLMDRVPPLVDAATLDTAIQAGCAAAGIAVLAPGTDYSKQQELTPEQFAALSDEDLARYQADMARELADVAQMPEGTGRGTRLYGVGVKYGALAKHDARFAALVDAALSALPGSPSGGDQRDFGRGVEHSKGVSQQAIAARNQAYRQFVQDWRTGQPRTAVVDELRAGKSKERRPSTLEHLLTRAVEPLTQVVDKLVPSKGLFLIAADPKAGKSYLATDMLLSVAEGSLFVGFPCVQGSAMYIALEETHSEFMDRVHKIRPAGNFDAIKRKFRAVFFDEGVPRLEADFKGGLLEFMDDMLAEDPTLRVFCLDTLQHALGDIESGQQKNSYKIEYEAIGWLQKYALSRNVAIVLLHHTNKSSADNAGRRISGSQGVTAAVSGYMELQVADENPYAMTVRGRVRGVGIFKYDWTRQEGVSVWQPSEGTVIDGNDGSRGMKERVYNVMVAAGCELTPADVKTRLKIDERVAAARLGDLRREGRLQQPHRGVYCIQGAAPRVDGIVIAILKSNATVPATNELRMTHDPEGKFSRWADMDAVRFGFEGDVVEAIEAAGFHDGKYALKQMDIRKLTRTKDGVVWFFGPSWHLNSAQQPLPWAQPAPKTPWS
jgi:hypothetical protein